MRSMLYRIVYIVLVGSILKICDTVIKRVSIDVSCFVPLRTRPNKCFKN